jgi:hypothetical protein
VRIVTLIQFTNHTNEDYGYAPNLYTWYQVRDMDSEYDMNDDDEDSDMIPAIRVYRNPISISMAARRTWLIVNDDGTEYNTMTIELDDNSPLFK